MSLDRAKARHSELWLLVRANYPAVVGRRSENVRQGQSKHQRVRLSIVNRLYVAFLSPCARGKTTGRLIPILWMQVESVASSETAASPPYDDELLITRATCRSFTRDRPLRYTGRCRERRGISSGDLAAFVSGSAGSLPACTGLTSGTSGIQEIF